MKPQKKYLQLFLLLSFYFISARSSTPQIDHQTSGFKENKGQVSDQFYHPRADILFSGTDGKLVYHLKNNGISYQLSRVDRWKKEEKDPASFKNDNTELIPDQTTVYRLDVNWLNADPNTVIKTGMRLQSVDNFYLEACPQGALNVKSYSQITYQQLYPGIDLKWYTKNGHLKYDYLVAAGVDHKQIQLEFKGANKITINKKGELIIKTPLGDLIEEAPVVLQNNKQLLAHWTIKKNSPGKTLVSFDIKNIDPAQPFIIDPLIRLWGTYYGGTNDENGNNVHVDPLGDVYLCGETKSNNALNIATVGSWQQLFIGALGLADAYIVKFNSAGVRQWGTYYGGNGVDFANGCYSDASGNIFVTGGTSSPNPAVITTPGAYQTSSSGGGGGLLTADAFLVKFNSAGVRIWGTYYGGPGYEFAESCMTDLSGNLYMTGTTTSTNNIATPGSHQPNFGGAADAFMVKFDNNGARLWGTYYGGSNTENGYGCSADASGNTYFCGVANTTTGTAIATPGSHQSVYGGNFSFFDAYLVKFDPAGVRQWGTYYGGGAADAGFACCVKNNAVYMTGLTGGAAASIISSAGSYQSLSAGNWDAYLVKFDLGGIRQWGSYYGGPGREIGTAISADNSGNIYLAGLTESGSGIATSCTYQFNYGGNRDAFLAKFTPNGSRLWGTYYGGNGLEDWPACDTDPTGNIYLAGSTSTSSGTVIAGTSSHQPLYNGGNGDAFIAKFDGCIPQSPPNTTPLPDMIICPNNSTNLTTSFTCGVNWYSSLTSTTAIGSGSIYTTASLNNTTTFYIEELSCGVSAPRTPVEVTVAPIPTITINAFNDMICAGQSATLSANGAINYTWAASPDLNSTSDATVIASPLINSTYYATGSNGICPGTGSVSVQVIPKPVLTVLSTNYVSCLGTPAPMTASGAQNYTWSPSTSLSSTTGSFVFASPLTNTTYTITGSVFNGTITCANETTYPLNVLPYAQAAVVNNLFSICEGDDVVLTASGGNTFSWSPTAGIKDPLNFGIIASPTINTVYTVTVSTNYYCGTTATVLVNVNPKPKIDAGRDTVFYLKEPMFINALSNATVTWIDGEVWCNDCPYTQIFPVRYSCYTAQAINEFGCKATDQVCVDVANQNGLFIPNSFTPNDDGLNDQFYISGFGITDINLEIFDRWGEKLFFTNDITKSWNGYYNGAKCEVGVYVYKLNYKTPDGKRSEKTGHISLIK